MCYQIVPCKYLHSCTCILRLSGKCSVLSDGALYVLVLLYVLSDSVLYCIELYCTVRACILVRERLVRQNKLV